LLSGRYLYIGGEKQENLTKLVKRNSWKAVDKAEGDRETILGLMTQRTKLGTLLLNKK